MEISLIPARMKYNVVVSVFYMKILNNNVLKKKKKAVPRLSKVMKDKN